MKYKVLTSGISSFKFKMENSSTVVRNDGDSNEEWSSFCSSCKSILQNIYSTGEPSFLDEVIDELFGKNKINRQIEKNGNITENINTINLKEKSNNDGIKEIGLNQKTDEEENSVILNTLEDGIILIGFNSSDKSVSYNETLRNLISLKKSQNETYYNIRRNILNHCRKILKFTKSILYLRYAFKDI